MATVDASMPVVRRPTAISVSVELDTIWQRTTIAALVASSFIHSLYSTSSGLLLTQRCFGHKHSHKEILEYRLCLNGPWGAIAAPMRARSMGVRGVSRKYYHIL